MSTGFMAVFLLLAIAAYACGGGTDYGAGFWGPAGSRRHRRHRAVRHPWRHAQLYRLDTHGELEGLTDADLRRW
ncbi:hypothetical protein ACIRP2_26835 [Streptomyces sp. NPDC101194]|uniref:hypothetical protein n=1 Tax=Streptomyces sp. NPDC101194 TaxID=3366127 RepID=UPI00380CBCAD